MELEGLKVCLKRLKALGLEVDVLITDRHKQIGKFVRVEVPAYLGHIIKHFYDLWHIAKGIHGCSRHNYEMFIRY